MKPACAVTLLLALASCLVACAPDWDGHFMGVIEEGGTCSDGSPFKPTNLVINVHLQDNGSTVTWEDHCGTSVVAVVEGLTAKVQPYSCPHRISNGITSIGTIRGGTVTLDGDFLHMDLNGVIEYSGEGISAGCGITLKGTVSRQPN